MLESGSWGHSVLQTPALVFMKNKNNNTICCLLKILFRYLYVYLEHFPWDCLCLTLNVPLTTAESCYNNLKCLFLNYFSEKVKLEISCESPT